MGQGLISAGGAVNASLLSITNAFTNVMLNTFFCRAQGWKNISLYFVAFSVSLSGQVLDGLSRCTVHC